MVAVAVSVLNYGAAEETARCIESLLGSREAVGVDLRIAVADNGSDPGDYETLARLLTDLPGVRLFRHERNLGFSAGHNRNIERLLAGGPPDFFWLLNNDCRVGEETLQAFLECARQRPVVGIWGATLLEADGRRVQCAGGCFYRPWLSSYRSHGAGLPVEEVESMEEPEFDYVAGASLFMPAATLAEGLDPPRGHGKAVSRPWLNEEFFLYFEELDLARRLRPGWSMGWCRRAVVQHDGGLGTGSGAARRSARGEYHSTLSALKYTALYRPAPLWLMAPARLLAKTAVNLLTLRLDLLRPLWAAYGAFLRWRGGGG